MKKGFIEELRKRGMLASITQGAEAELNKDEMKVAYIGTDPTGKSLHIAHLAAFSLAKLFQMYGGKPIILIGNATAKIGDPSFKSQERNLMMEDEVERNTQNIEKQLRKFIDFDINKPNGAILVKNDDWMKDYSFMDFSRNVGKLITVNYMMSKASVQKRLERDGEGMSFLEFTYQLIQGNDFKHLMETYNCEFQFSGEDQIGNATTGIALIHKTLQRDAHYVTCPLLLDANGNKIGKTTNNASVYLDPTMTTPYAMYQYLFNLQDDVAEKLIKWFVLTTPIEELEALIEEHKKAPHKRLLQTTLAKEVVTMIHSAEDYENAVKTSQILFGNATKEELESIDQNTLMSVDGVNKFTLTVEEIKNGLPLSELIVTKAQIAPSKNEFRKLVQGGGLSINKTKITDINTVITKENLLQDKFLFIQKGKKSYSLAIVS